MTKRKQLTSNWAKAPESANFVKQMRGIFGEDVKVLFVKEGSLDLGESTDPNRPLSEVQRNAA